LVAGEDRDVDRALAVDPQDGDGVGRIGDTQEGLLTVSDDGAGFRPGVSDTRRGLTLMRRLMSQIGGTLEVRSDRGVRCNMRFRIGIPPPP
jgi:two-component sensor histidine kinase